MVAFFVVEIFIEIVVDSLVVIRTNVKDDLCTLSSFHQWKHCTQLQYIVTTSVLTWCRPSHLTHMSLVLFYSFVSLCTRVCRSIQFYHLCMFVFLPPQSRHWAVPLAFQPGSILLPYYNHTISPLPATPSPWQPLPCPLFVKFSHFRMLHTVEHNRKSRK